MKHIKTLGLLAVAAMAIAAFVGTSSASAEFPGSFTATGGAGKKLETSKVAQHVFTVTGSEVKCNKVTFTGNTEGAETTSQMVTPAYEECTAFGLPATVTNNNCTITLTATTNAAGHAVAHLERVDPLKPCEMTILAKSIFGECHVDVTEQTITGLHYLNNPNPEDIVVQVTAENMTDHVTKSTGVCPLTVGTHTNAKYTGEETVQATGGVQYMATPSAGAP